METGKLTALAIQSAGLGKHFDGGGLTLEVLPSRSRVWRLNSRHAGRESRTTFGRCPEVSLSEARARRDDARKLLRDGIDPNAARVIADKRAWGSAFPVAGRLGWRTATASDPWAIHRRGIWASANARQAVRPCPDAMTNA